MGQYRILVHGGGRIAQTIANTLAADQRYEVLLSAPESDPDGQIAPALHPEVRRGSANLSSSQLIGISAIIMAGNVWANTAYIARIARQVGSHYLDISENPDMIADIADVAQGATHCFAPACGLAPGYVTALTAETMRLAGPSARVTAHVGVLPARRTNRLGYGNLLGLDGLMVEYFSPCLAIRRGRKTSLPPLSELEKITLAGECFESFTTAGSLDALVHMHDVAVDSLLFKTLRYPGHLEYIRFLLEDLGFAQRRRQLRAMLMNGLPIIEEDRVLIALDVQHADQQRDWFEQVITARRNVDGKWCSAGITATVAHVCAMADLLCTGAVRHKGFLSQASVSLKLLEQSIFFKPLARARSPSEARKSDIAHD